MNTLDNGVPEDLPTLRREEEVGSLYPRKSLGLPVCERRLRPNGWGVEDGVEDSALPRLFFAGISGALEGLWLDGLVVRLVLGFGGGSAGALVAREGVFFAAGVWKPSPTDFLGA